MAYRNAPLHGLSVTQLKLIVQARNKPGIHAYYPSGYEESVIGFWSQTWSEWIDKDCVSTYLFHCKKLAPYGLQFGMTTSNFTLDFHTEKISVGNYYYSDLPITIYGSRKFDSIGFHVIEIKGIGGGGRVTLDAEDLEINDPPLLKIISVVKLTSRFDQNFFITDAFNIWEHHFYGANMSPWAKFSNKMLFPTGFACFEPGCHVVFDIVNETQSEAEISYCGNLILKVDKSGHFQRGFFVNTTRGLLWYNIKTKNVVPLPTINTKYAIAAFWRLSQPVKVYDLSWCAIASAFFFTSCKEDEMKKKYPGCDIDPSQCIPDHYALKLNF